MGKKRKGEECSKHTYEEVDEEIFSDIIDYFINQESHLLMLLQANRLNNEIRQKIRLKAETQFRLRGIAAEKLMEKYMETFEKYLWGYYKLDPLLEDKTISDISCYSFDNIRIKRKGKRESGNVRFRDENDYRRFVSMAVTKNEMNLSAINSQVNFSDYTSNENFILRFNVSHGQLQTSAAPFMHIRKELKKKPLLDDLEKDFFMTREQKRYLKRKVTEASGIYITGKGSAGKTTLLNALLEEIPVECSGVGVSESDDLITNHPDFVLQHMIRRNGEGRINYTLKDLVTTSLKTDRDYVVISEITGDEAAALSVASYTGYKCWATGHGASARDGIEKLADYIRRATGDAIEQCRKVLSKMEVIIFLKDYHVEEIVEVTGFANGNFVFRQMFGGDTG